MKRDTVYCGSLHCGFNHELKEPREEETGKKKKKKGGGGGKVKVVEISFIV